MLRMISLLKGLRVIEMKDQVKEKLEEVRRLLYQSTMNGNSLENTAILVVMERDLNRLLEYTNTYLD